MHLEGESKEVLDAAAVDFGMPMGPIELADVVGLDVCNKVAETLAGDGVEKQRQMLNEMLAKKHFGKKSGQGFYEWKDGKAVKESIEGEENRYPALAERLIKPFLDECKKCSDEGIVADDELLDAGIIFGTGFAPFHGGPMNYLANYSGKSKSAVGAKS